MIVSDYHKLKRQIEAVRQEYSDLLSNVETFAPGVKLNDDRITMRRHLDQLHRIVGEEDTRNRLAISQQGMSAYGQTPLSVAIEEREASVAERERHLQRQYEQLHREEDQLAQERAAFQKARTNVYQEAATGKTESPRPKSLFVVAVLAQRETPDETIETNVKVKAIPGYNAEAVAGAALYHLTNEYPGSDGWKLTVKTIVVDNDMLREVARTLSLTEKEVPDAQGGSMDPEAGGQGTSRPQS